MRREEEEGGGKGEGGDQKKKQNHHLRGEEKFEAEANDEFLKLSHRSSMWSSQG